STGIFISGFTPKNKGGMGTIQVAIYSVKYPATRDTVSFVGTAWTTATREVNSTKEFGFYPNPAKDKITIKYPAKDAIAVDIYNILGTKVKSVVHQGTETEISI